MPSLKIESVTHERLTKVVGKIMSITGKNATYDDAIAVLIETMGFAEESFEQAAKKRMGVE